MKLRLILEILEDVRLKSMPHFLILSFLIMGSSPIWIRWVLDKDTVKVDMVACAILCCLVVYWLNTLCLIGHECWKRRKEFKEIQ